MNCKPGDLAVIVRQSKSMPELLGRILTTLYVAPDHDFSLPDGFRQLRVTPSSYPVWWVVEFASPIHAPTKRGRRVTVFGVVPDACLRPLRDSDGTDEMIRIAGLPNKEPSNV